KNTSDLSQRTPALPYRVDLLPCNKHRQTPTARAKLMCVHHHLYTPNTHIHTDTHTVTDPVEEIHTFGRNTFCVLPDSCTGHAHTHHRNTHTHIHCYKKTHLLYDVY